MSYFRDVFGLKRFADRLINLGIGHAQPMLDRRGCECGKGPVRIGDPGEGERVSADGSQVYLTCRRMEE